MRNDFCWLNYFLMFLILYWYFILDTVVIRKKKKVYFLCCSLLFWLWCSLSTYLSYFVHLKIDRYCLFWRLIFFFQSVKIVKYWVLLEKNLIWLILMLKKKLNDFCNSITLDFILTIFFYCITVYTFFFSIKAFFF